MFLLDRKPYRTYVYIAFPFGSGHCLGHLLEDWMHYDVLCVPTSAEEIERETIVHLLRLVIILIVPQL